MKNYLYIKIKIFQKTKDGEKFYKKINQKIELENFDKNADIRAFLDEIFELVEKFYDKKKFRLVFRGGVLQDKVSIETFFEEE